MKINLVPHKAHRKSDPPHEHKEFLHSHHSQNLWKDYQLGSPTNQFG